MKMSSLKGIISMLVLILAVYFAYSPATFYSLINYVRNILHNKQSASYGTKKNQMRLITSEELKLYNGVTNSKIYLSILGIVYDVSKGRKHYGPGKSYHFFVGKDTSKSFVTGKFEEKYTSDDVADFNHGDFKSLKYWIDFYNKEYTEIGKLIGRYYNEQGEITPYGVKIQKLIALALQSSEAEDAEKRKYPPCNVEWNAVTGSRVWCTNRSGGIERSWVGFPRKLYEVGSKSHRCACMNENDLRKENIKEYKDCLQDSHSCYVPNE